MDTPRTIRVLLADDQPLMAAGIAMILQSSPGIEVVGQAENGVAAVAMAKELTPDVVCMDIQMPVMDGLEATRQIVNDPDLACAVIILTTFQQEEYLVDALSSGACGYLLKNTRPESVVEAVRAAADGDGLIAPELTRAVIRRAFEVTPKGPGTVLPVEFTGREREVLELMAEGMSNDEIAEHLFLGRTTIKTHVSNVLLKLGVRDRIQAVVWAHRHSVVD